MAVSHCETLESIKYSQGSLQLLDQRKLPLETKFDVIQTVNDIWLAIQEMRVRGAPAIAVSAALGIAVAAARELAAQNWITAEEAMKFIAESCDYVITSRPTAVNLANTLLQLKTEMLAEVSRLPASSPAQVVVDLFTRKAEEVFQQDVAFNEGIMKHGASHLREKSLLNRPKGVSGGLRVLTICNTGALATSRYGTALGVIRQLHYQGDLAQVYACETRPWNQGARLTVYECAQENIPCTLICDGAVSALLASANIDAVIVGADRICANGDTANKIGTYDLAVAAKYHGVDFYVAAPSTTLDPSTASGNEVKIEERDTKEITTNLATGERVVADGPHLSIWNPVFDITPAQLITGGIITEKGVFEPAKTAPYFSIQEIIDA